MLSRISISASHIICIWILAGNVNPVQISRNDENDENDILLPIFLDAFVAYVFSTKNKTGNEFFEVKFKIAETTCVTIRTMKQEKIIYQDQIKLNRRNANLVRRC